MIDQHTHCYFSFDSKQSPTEAIEYAILSGLTYLAFTDHVDYDMKYCRKDVQIDNIGIDILGHHEEILSLQRKYKDKIYIANGLEFSFCKKSENEYIEIAKSADLDIIVNAVHTVYGDDCYRAKFYERNPDKSQAYNNYLTCIRESVYASYDYDIIAHLGYIMRNSLYKDRILYVKSNKEILCEILEGIIEKDKTLEVNTHTKQLPFLFLPTYEILQLYKDLGGKNISFGSDAHIKERQCDKFLETSQILLDMGFENFSIYKKRKREEIGIAALIKKYKIFHNQ